MSLLNSMLPHAIAGHAESQFQVAELWFYFGRAQDIAIYWYRRAFAAGYDLAALRLAELHFHDRGRYRDCEEACYWCLLAVVRGVPRAREIYPAIRASTGPRAFQSVTQRLLAAPACTTLAVAPRRGASLA